MNQNQPSNITTIITAMMLMGTLYGSPLSAQEKSVDWHSFEEAIQLGEEKQLPILVDVWAPWCGWCKKMREEVYPALSENLTQGIIWTRLNRDDNETNLRFKNQPFTPLRLAQKLNVESVPAIVFLSPEGEYIFHISGFLEAEALEPVFDYVVSGSYKDKSLEVYLANIE